ncbi:DUF6207 family protein [Streptomyces sp. NBC_00057]|uniref:DUF6207 family protein n=1 Tax=Streptomyces sp. NBC_00057 TaxID=2975634 RepID=UPI00324B699F
MAREQPFPGHRRPRCLRTGPRAAEGRQAAGCGPARWIKGSARVRSAAARIDALGRRWATSGGGRVRRVPGEPGVTARLYADIRRPGSEGAAAPE